MVKKMDRVVFCTYPMAFFTPGGGEIQLSKYEESLKKLNYPVQLFDMWNPNIPSGAGVHFFSTVGGSYNFCEYIRGRGWPLIISSSLWLTEEMIAQYPVSEIKAQLLLANKIICNSRAECENLSSFLQLDLANFSVVYNAVDPVYYNKVPGSLFIEGFNITRPYILNVGNIEKRKNQLALARVMKSFPEYDLVLIGGVRDKKYLAQIKEELPSAKVIHRLPAGSEMLRSAYAGADCFCLPSTLETPGLAALEAAASGVPLVITSIGCTVEYFGNYAQYVNPYSDTSIKDGLAKALANSSELSRRTVNLLDWDEVAKSLINVYRDV